MEILGSKLLLGGGGSRDIQVNLIIDLLPVLPVAEGGRKEDKKQVKKTACHLEMF